MQQNLSDNTGALMDRALGLLRVPEDQKQTARGWIEGVAEALRKGLAPGEKPPRLADTKKRRAEAVKNAERLRGFLERDLPNVRRVAAGYDLMATQTDLDRGETGIPKVLGYNPQHLLTALSEFIDIIGPLGEAWPIASGGEKDIASMFEGTPKQVFAVRCWELFTWFRPEEATASESGEYHKFTACLYEFATDKQPDDDHAGLERYTKIAAGKCNDYTKRNPIFDRVRRAIDLDRGESPIGFIEAAIGPKIFDTPNRLYDRIMGRGHGTT